MYEKTDIEDVHSIIFMSQLTSPIHFAIVKLQYLIFQFRSSIAYCNNERGKEKFLFPAYIEYVVEFCPLQTTLLFKFQVYSLFTNNEKLSDRMHYVIREK